MKISLNYLRQYLDFDLPSLTSLVERIEARLGALEEPPLNLSEVYTGVVIVRIVKVQPLENSDHLNLCLIEDNKVVPNVKRNSDGLVEVVCGAPNVKAGLLVAWLPPGATVPASFSKDRLVLEARPIRGHISSGMLASSQELALGDDHSGLLLIDDPKASPGQSLAQVLELDDYVLDIENKMFTHRPDCFGLLGVAREVSGIFNQPFKSPKWYLKPESIKPEDHLALKAKVDIPKMVPRFCLVVLSGLEVKPSPLGLQSYLARMGLRPVNNIVDLTNLIMIETGQPLHAYDYHKLLKLAGQQEPTLGVRAPRDGEKLQLLNGKEVTIPPESIAITINDQLVGLGGIMGGDNSQVDEQTTAIVLEAATFDMYTIRRTSMQLGIFSDAVSRFTKGQSPLQTVRILNYSLRRFKQLVPSAKVASEIIDVVNLPNETLKNDYLHPPIRLTLNFINDRLGTKLKTDQVAKLLTNVECRVKIQKDQLLVTAPFWRTDLEISEDIVEEIGRLYGYENIKPQNLSKEVSAVSRNKSLDTQTNIRTWLAAAGANELLTYSFISQRLIVSSSQDPTMAYELANSLSPQLSYYRLSLLPSLLAKVPINIKAGLDNLALFEIGRFHLKGQLNHKEKQLPAEFSSLALVYSAKQPLPGAAFYRARAFVDYLAAKFNIAGLSYLPFEEAKVPAYLAQLAKPFNEQRTALVTVNEQVFGLIGELRPQVVADLKLPNYTAGFELDLAFFAQANLNAPYSLPPKYPAVKQDITLSIAADQQLNFKDIRDFLVSDIKRQVDEAYLWHLTPLSIFKPKSPLELKNYSFHLEISHKSRTLKEAEVSQLLDNLAKSAKSKFSAQRV